LQLLNANGSVYDAASILDAGLWALPYSRKHETEADKLGYDMLSTYGMNPVGMADTFNILAGGKKADGFGEMLSTHPDPAKRASSIKERIRKDSKKFPRQKMLPFRTKAMDSKSVTSPKDNSTTLSLTPEYDWLAFLNPASSIHIPRCECYSH